MVFLSFEGSTWYLLLICGSEFVGYLPNAVEVYVITRVTALPLSNDVTEVLDSELEVTNLELAQQTNINSTPGIMHSIKFTKYI